MLPKNRRKKRVTIRPGYQAKYIEKRQTKRLKSKPLRSRRKTSNLRKTAHLGPQAQKPTVSELVYQFLEQASRKGTNYRRKCNATSQFRRLQRRNRPKKPISRPKRGIPYRPLPTRRNLARHGDVNIKKCIYDVLSFGTIMGFIEPVTDDGAVFRVASDLQLTDTN